MKLAPLLAISLLTSFAAPDTVAAVDAERLIQGCQELIEIYESHDKKRLLAGPTTSLSEALRAGYCMGVISQYQNERHCAVEDWYIVAAHIADAQGWQGNSWQTETLLVNACGQ